jgi:hypothetical protein
MVGGRLDGEREADFGPTGGRGGYGNFTVSAGSGPRPRPRGYCGTPWTTKVRHFATFSRSGRRSLNAIVLRYAWYFSRLSHC